MTVHDDMEKTWGVAATHAEHHISDHIRYCIEGQTRTGSIIWIFTSTEQDGQFQPIRYVVRPDGRTTDTDLICPATLLVDEAQKQQGQGSDGSASLDVQQGLIEMLATLSIPIIVKEEIDDNGNPFYVWHIGTSTLRQPFGMYVGTSRQLIDALEFALERLIKHVSQHQ